MFDGRKPRRFKVWKLGWPAKLGAEEARTRLRGVRRPTVAAKGFLARWRT